MKFSSALAVALSALLSLSIGCSDAVQPEPDATVAWVAVSGPEQVSVGRTVQLSARAFYTRGYVVSAPSFTWRSSDEAIATVNWGEVTGKATGTVTIYATTAGKTGSKSLSVGEPGGDWDY